MATDRVARRPKLSHYLVSPECEICGRAIGDDRRGWFHTGRSRKFVRGSLRGPTYRPTIVTATFCDECGPTYLEKWVNPTEAEVIDELFLEGGHD